MPSCYNLSFRSFLTFSPAYVILETRLGTALKPSAQAVSALFAGSLLCYVADAIGYVVGAYAARLEPINQPVNQAF